MKSGFINLAEASEEAERPTEELNFHPVIRQKKYSKYNSFIIQKKIDSALSKNVKEKGEMDYCCLIIHSSDCS